MTALELVAVVVTVAAVYLTARQIIWCWPLAMVSVTLYAVVFYRARLYADMGLQGIYFALAAYGWWAWLHGAEDHGKLRVSLAAWPTRFSLLLLGAVAGVLLGLTAQWMQTRKLLEAWLVWLAVDVFYVGMFLYKGLFLTAGLYAVFLYLAVLGLVAWRRSMADTRAIDTPLEE
jgi:nicotinamide mononucleotide transporter